MLLSRALILISDRPAILSLIALSLFYFKVNLKRGSTDGQADDLSDMFDFQTMRPFALHIAPKKSIQELKAMKSTRAVDDDH